MNVCEEWHLAAAGAVLPLHLGFGVGALALGGTLLSTCRSRCLLPLLLHLFRLPPHLSPTNVAAHQLTGNNIKEEKTSAARLHDIAIVLGLHERAQIA